MSHARREKHLWRYVRYACGSYKAWCLVDHAERAARMRECKDCVHIPAIEDEIRDHRLISLLWAYQLAAETTARTGTAEDGSQFARSGRGQGPAPDPEAGPHEVDGRRPKTSGSKAQRRPSGFIRTDGGFREQRGHSRPWRSRLTNYTCGLSKRRMSVGKRSSSEIADA